MPTFFISGANRGIGLELARQASAGGAHVFAACRMPEKATALQKLAGQVGSRIQVVELEVTSDDSVAGMQKAVGGVGIDVLINNAGIMGPDPQTPLDMDYDALAEIFAVNAIGPLRVTHALMDNVIAAKGKIAVVSSMMGAFGFSGTGKIGYCTSKTAVNRLFHAMAQDLKPQGIPVAILSPGWVRTDMGGPNASISVEESAAGLLKQIDGWTLEKSGAFGNYAGQAMQW